MGIDAVAEDEGEGDCEAVADPVRVVEEHGVEVREEEEDRTPVALVHGEAAPDCVAEAEAQGDAEVQPLLLGVPQGEGEAAGEGELVRVGSGLVEDERDKVGEVLPEEEKEKSGVDVPVRLKRVVADAQPEPVAGTSVREAPLLRVPAEEPQLLGVPLGEPVSL